MREHTEREERLSEELLELVTGASGNDHASTSTGSFLDCPSCQEHAQKYDQHIYLRDGFQFSVDRAANMGNPALADKALKLIETQHTKAQESYDQMAAHGHADFPAALRQQRQGYDPSSRR